MFEESSALHSAERPLDRVRTIARQIISQGVVDAWPVNGRQRYSVELSPMEEPDGFLAEDP
jgi:hypothetical protein